ncbi:MAG: PAS domain-containing protein, partial [Desulfotignum sp.]|nr:PAS domain-containing protein [Desulfotignum sp.]
MNNLDSGVVVHAPDTSIMLANQSACRIMGLSENQMLGREAIDPQWKFLRGDGSDMPIADYPVKRVLSTKKGIHDQVVGVTHPASGDIAWVLVNGFPVFEDADTIEQVVITFVDITEIKRAQEALLSANEKMRLAADSAHFGVWDLDLRKNRLEWDDWMFRLYGISRDKFSGAYEAWQAGVHPDDLERSSREVEKAVRGEKEFDTEFRIVRPNGEIRHLKAHATVSRDDRGDPIKMTGINYDITERKQLDARLRQAQEMESIGTLAGGIAHDFNNLLTPIKGMSELLLADLPDDSLERENAEEILKAGRRGRDLVKQILTFSRQSKQKMIPTHIQHVIKELLKLTRSTIPSYVEIHQDIQSDCGMVMADPTQIHQVAMNIIMNAYHAVEEQGGKISVSLKESEYKIRDSSGIDLETGQYAVLSISDNGHGMPSGLMD